MNKTDKVVEEEYFHKIGVYWELLRRSESYKKAYEKYLNSKSVEDRDKFEIKIVNTFGMPMVNPETSYLNKRYSILHYKNKDRISKMVKSKDTLVRWLSMLDFTARQVRYVKGKPKFMHEIEVEHYYRNKNNLAERYFYIGVDVNAPIKEIKTEVMRVIRCALKARNMQIKPAKKFRFRTEDYEKYINIYEMYEKGKNIKDIARIVYKLEANDETSNYERMIRRMINKCEKAFSKFPDM